MGLEVLQAKRGRTLEAHQFCVPNYALYKTLLT